MVRKIKNRLYIKPDWIFNTFTVMSLKHHVDSSIKEVNIDLSNTEIVDTDAIKFILELSDKFDVNIKKPPQILFKVLKILDIEDVFIRKVNIEN